MTNKNNITARVSQTQLDQTRTLPKQKEGFLNINKSQEQLAVGKDQKVCIHKGAVIDNCYMFGGYMEAHAGAEIKNLIINAGEACLFTGSETGKILAKEGCTLTIRSNAKVHAYRQTGPITFSMYPGNRLNAPL